MLQNAVKQIKLDWTKKTFKGRAQYLILEIVSQKKSCFLEILQFPSKSELQYIISQNLAVTGFILVS